MRILNIALLSSILMLSHCKKDNKNTTTPAPDTTSPISKISFSKLATMGNLFAPISDHQTFVLNNKIWVIAGRSGSFTLNKVWNSNDGITWNHINSTDTTTNARYGHQAVAFNNRVYLIGGISQSVPLQDVWSTGDGINWIQETDSANFPFRFNHKAFAFNNKIWIIGGDGGVLKNDIWNSPDGKNWTKINTTGTIFSPRGEHDVVVFNNTIYLTGGYTASGRSDEVWSSSDGVSWTLLNTTKTKFLPIYGHQTLVYKDKIYLIGGITNNWGPATDEVWISENGKDWTLQTIEGNSYGKRVAHQAFIFNNKIYLLGGSDGSSIEYNDIWQMN